jgi:hypothetical protein
MTKYGGLIVDWLTGVNAEQGNWIAMVSPSRQIPIQRRPGNPQRPANVRHRDALVGVELLGHLDAWIVHRQGLPSALTTSGAGSSQTGVGSFLADTLRVRSFSMAQARHAPDNGDPRHAGIWTLEPEM